MSSHPWTHPGPMPTAQPPTPGPMWPPADPAPFGQPVANPPTAWSLPTGLKVLAVVTSILKAIPVALGAVVMLFIIGIGSDVQQQSSELQSDSDFDIVPGGFWSSFWTIVAVFVTVLAVASAVLIIQTWAALQSRIRPLVTVAAILSALDLLGLISSVTDEEREPASIVLMGLVFMVQAAILVWALSARTSKPTPPAINPLTAPPGSPLR